MWVTFLGLWSGAILLRVILFSCASNCLRYWSPDLWQDLRPWLVVLDILLVIGFVVVSRHWGQRYLAGGEEQRYLDKVWRFNKFGPEYLAPYLDDGDLEAGKRALANASAQREGAFLRHPLSGWVLALSILLSDRLYWVSLPHDRVIDGAMTHAALSIMLPALATPLLEYLVARWMVHENMVERVALIRPRQWSDHGLSRKLVLSLIALPLLLLFPSSFTEGTTRILLVTAMAVAMTGPALADFLLESFPFLKFPGPPLVSVWLDLRSRIDRIYFLVFMPASIQLFVYARLSSAKYFETASQGGVFFYLEFVLYTAVAFWIVVKSSEAMRDQACMKATLWPSAERWNKMERNEIDASD